MQRLVLIRHAEPEIEAHVPASSWRLTARGEASTRRLATELAALAPDRLITSPERKAVETARVAADALGLPIAEDDRFAEQGAGPDEFIEDYREFRARVREFFSRPGEVVWRRESAQAARERFNAGVDDLVAAGGTPVVVTHGRIMSAWLAAFTGGDAWDIWTGLRMPDLLDVDVEARAFRRVDFPLV